ncbi:MAG: hypothetical protein MI974_32995 [Chitinophagales bacterium]|nr:hypothetical protein [Chitinophagales bacterium]
MKTFILILIFIPLLIATSCIKENTPDPASLSENEVADLIEQTFPFTPNQPFNALYVCGRLGSQLEWYFLFDENNSMQVMFTTDTHDDYVFNGSYTYKNEELHLNMPGGATSPFPQGLDERSTVIMPKLGLVAAFATPEMICICQGHNLNTQAPPKAQANYDCPTINVQAASDEDNAIELMLRAAPFDLAVPGSIFRQQDTHINGLTNPVIRRGYGIYRTIGDRYYASFRIAQDFAEFANPNQLPISFTPGVPFEDHNLISGTIQNSYQELIVDQLKPEAGPCTLR